MDKNIRVAKDLQLRTFLYSGPLFTHQISHLWIDFRDIKDDYMRHKGSDYFLNSRIAALIQQQYAMEGIPTTLILTDQTAGALPPPTAPDQATA